MIILIVGINQNDFLEKYFDNSTSFYYSDTINNGIELTKKHVFNAIILDGDVFVEKELKSLRKLFKGVIIGRVESGFKGIKLVKSGLVNDFFVFDSNVYSLTKSLKRIDIDNNIRNSLAAINKDLATLSSLAGEKK